MLEIQYLVDEVENCNNDYAVTDHFDNLCGHSGFLGRVLKAP